MNGIIQIKYTVADDSYNVTSNLNKKGVDEIISAFAVLHRLNFIHGKNG